MKTFVSPSFFRLFDLLMSTRNLGTKRSKWIISGIDCSRERHGFSGHSHGFAVETFNLSRAGQRGWTLMVVKEYW
jgi:hypothetical protein